MLRMMRVTLYFRSIKDIVSGSINVFQIFQYERYKQRRVHTAMGKNDATKIKILNPRDANKNWSFTHKEDSIVLKQNGGTVKIC